ncbi:MAG TPA: hypothetical protein VG753_01345 [Candidatus Paceibacterota bacterium]|nr:hypothetical protein [Candidatus Paceibacterota bacterium]
MDKETKHQENPSQAPLPLALSEDLGKKDTLNTILDNYKKWLPRYQELAQGRSNFQIEKIIATEHATPAASYQHTLFQLRVLHQALMQDIVTGIERTREIEYKWQGKPHSEPVWWDNERGGKKLCWYDTDHLQYEHEMEELKMSVKDKLLQMETFTKVLSAMEAAHGGTFTQAELNDEEPEYWKLRLARQMADEYLDHQTGLGTGNIRSLRMAVAESPLEGSRNRIDDFPDIFNAVLGGKEAAARVLNDVNDMLLSRMGSLGSASATSLPRAEERREEAPRSVPPQPKNSMGPGDGPVERLKNVGITVSELED